jgi:hypothetical protein
MSRNVQNAEAPQSVRIVARTDLVASLCKIPTDGFKGAAEMPDKKSLGYCDLGKSIWWF